MPNANPQSRPAHQMRLALTAERERLRHYRKAMGCLHHPALKAYCRAELDASRSRVAQIAAALSGTDATACGYDASMQSANCLMDAMDAALRNGDMPAAEAVALECLKLIDLRAAQVQDGCL